MPTIYVSVDDAFLKELEQYARIKYRASTKQFLLTAANLVMNQKKITPQEASKDEEMYPRKD